MKVHKRTHHHGKQLKIIMAMTCLLTSFTGFAQIASQPIRITPSQLTPEADNHPSQVSQKAMDKSVQDAMSNINQVIETLPDALHQVVKSDPQFPMKSPLSVGSLKKQAVLLPKQVPPFYVIGDDLISIKWLTEHMAQLKSLHAAGFVTNINNRNRLLALEQQFDVVLHPVSLDGFDRVLPVSHYPFWYANGYIQQTQ